MMLIRRYLPWLIGAALLVGAAGLALLRIRHDAREDARAEAARAHARAVADSNRVWLKRYATVRADAQAQVAAAVAHERRADSIEADTAPAPQRGEVTDSALIAYWEGKAEERRVSNVELRLALYHQKMAYAKLLAAADTSAGRLDTTTTDLDAALERERMKGRFRIGLGLSLPKPPKWLAATLGCTAGGLLANRLSPRQDERAKDTALGCAAGAALVTTVTPTD
jgi:hypothetical protein